MINKAILVGNLGRDPETATTTSGKQICKFSLATGRGEYTEWHNIVCFDKIADNCAQYLSKGRTVFVEGEIRTRSWDDKDTGKKMYRTEVVAFRVQFLGQRQPGETPATNDGDEIPF